VTTGFDNSRGRFDRQIKKLLHELEVTSVEDLRKLDPWSLTGRPGVGRGTVRKLLKLMADAGIEISPSPKKGSSAGGNLVVRFNPPLSDLVRERARLIGVKPDQWVLDVIGAVLKDRR
jgi:hypothetical protein